MESRLTKTSMLPDDGDAGTLVGRVWVPGNNMSGMPPGPSVMAIKNGKVIDLSCHIATMADLIKAEDSLALARREGPVLGDLDEILANSAHDRCDPSLPYILSPVDLQVLKASGVTFARSMVERVIEEQARGDATRAEAIRQKVKDVIGDDLSRIKPGSAAAMRLKAHLIEEGAWSQYLEVGIGPDAEIFTKGPVLSAVGTGAKIGIRRDSSWNNPEPELVLVIDHRGRIKGATLGNDVNLRDFEGRSALLLGKSKDNNASSAIGPFIRLLDESLSLDALRKTTIGLEVKGDDGFCLEGSSSMAEISRDLLDLVDQTINKHHHYPDGLILFTGTMFAPTQDRGVPGEGFTHKEGDQVTIYCPELGRLVNKVAYADAAPPWTFGLGDLMRNLAARGLI